MFSIFPTAGSMLRGFEMSTRTSGRVRRDRAISDSASLWSSGSGEAVAVTTTSAMESTSSSASKGRASPPSSPASASARSSVRFRTSSRAGACSAMWVATSRPVSPAPTTATVCLSRPSKTLSAISTAAYATDTVPSPISVSVRARLPTWSAVLNSRVRIAPVTRLWSASLYASRTCPRIWGSPTISDSIPDATRKRWRTMSRPPSR